MNTDKDIAIGSLYTLPPFKQARQSADINVQSPNILPWGCNQGDQKIGEKLPKFLKSCQNSNQAEKYQNIYINVQF